MRSPHKAEELRQAAALELVLEHPHGQAILEASNGDAEHALRILDELKARRRDEPPIGEVIRLPREPILDFRDVVDETLEEPPPALAAWSWPAILTFALAGVVLWAILAGVAYAIFRLVQAFTS